MNWDDADALHYALRITHYALRITQIARNARAANVVSCE
jgi:hypothetical protein